MDIGSTLLLAGFVGCIISLFFFIVFLISYHYKRHKYHKQQYRGVSERYIEVYGKTAVPIDHRAKSLNKRHHTAILCAMIFFIILIIGNSIIMDENTSYDVINAENSQPTNEIKVIAPEVEISTISPEDYMSSAVTIPYDDLVREPDKYIGEIIQITIEIAHVYVGGIVEGDFVSAAGYLGYSDNDEWCIRYDIPEDVPRIINDDIVTFWGVFNGLEVMTRTITELRDYVPSVTAKYHVIN